MKLTRQQQKALHVGFGLLADDLNNAGLDMRTVLKPEIDIPWTKDSVKEYLWRPVQKIMYQKSSTTELDKIGEIEKEWDVLMRHLGEKFGLEYIPFPHDPEKLKEEIGGYKTNAGQGARGVEYPEYEEPTI